MEFEKIGPYGLSRGDLVAASLTISFLIGSRYTRIKSALYILAGIAAVAAGLALRDWIVAAAGLFWVVWIFVLGPALRSRARSHDIYLSYDEAGIVADTPTHRTTYKWDTIERVRWVGSRLYIMIAGNLALVLADRISSRANIDALAASIARHKADEKSAA